MCLIMKKLFGILLRKQEFRKNVIKHNIVISLCLFVIHILRRIKDLT